MGAGFDEWVYEVLAVPRMIRTPRRARAAALILADAVRLRVDISDRDAEQVFTPVLRCIDDALDRGMLDDVLLGRSTADMKLARSVRDLMDDIDSAPVGRDVLAEIVRDVVDELVRLGGRRAAGS